MKYKLLKPINNFGEIGAIRSTVDEAMHTPEDKCLAQLLLDLGYIEEYDENKKWEPKMEEEYFYVYEDGNIGDSNWGISDYHFKRANFGNIYQTKEEAETARDKIKAFVANGFK